AQALAAGLMRAAVGGLHDAGPAARADDEPVAGRLERLAPLREPPGDRARVFVVARPFERLARALERGGVLRSAAVVPLAETRDGARRVLPAVHARGPEEHDGVLDVLLLEASQRLEVL